MLETNEEEDRLKMKKSYFNLERIDNYLRITIGTEGEMEKLFGFLRTYLEK